MKTEEFGILEIGRGRRAATSDVKKPVSKFMISAEAPALMTKACEFFIREVSTRAWKHTENHRRKTLQRADIHAAVGESEVFDFLIDIVPRVTANVVTSGPMGQPAVADGTPTLNASLDPGDVPHFNFENLQLPTDENGLPEQPSIPQIHQQWSADGATDV